MAAPVPALEPNLLRSGTCGNCGAEIQGAKYERFATCAFCKHQQPNAVCLQKDDEVLLSGQSPGEFLLYRVTACAGPDAIDLVGITEGKACRVALEDVVPVVRAPPDLLPGTLVYAKDVFGWAQTFTATRASRHGVKVKDPEGQFQDSFFDSALTLSELRIPAREQDRRTRTAREALIERFKSDPLGVTVSLGFKLLLYGFLLLCLGFFAFILWTVAHGN